MNLEDASQRGHLGDLEDLKEFGGWLAELWHLEEFGGCLAEGSAAPNAFGGFGAFLNYFFNISLRLLWVMGI